MSREAKTMRFTFLGGADEVGASCTLVEVAGRRLVFDCGVRLHGPDPLPWMQPIQDAGGADAIILTHAHLDHCGALPLLIQTNNVPVYMTPPTRMIMDIMLHDSLKIMAIEAEREGEIPMYPEAAVDLLVGLSQMVDWGTPLVLFNGDIRLTFLPAGHILGASSVLIESSEGTALMGGDIARAEQRTVPGMDWSGVPSQVDALICESTYGGRAHSSRRGEELRLIQQAAQIVDRNGVMVIPAFAVGRAQEILSILSYGIEHDMLAPVPIYYDGLIRQVCRAYTMHEAYVGTWFKKRLMRSQPYQNNIKPVSSPASREYLTEGGAAIIVSSSGMLTGGPSAYYASRVASKENAFIAITGYQDEESPGRAVQQVAAAGGGRLNLNGTEVDLKCGVGVYGLSAHADTTEITAALTALRPRHTFLVHGSHEARAALTGALERVDCPCVFSPRLGQTFEVHGRSAFSKRRKNDPLPIPEPTYIPTREALTKLADTFFARDRGRRSYLAEQLLNALGHHLHPHDLVTLRAFQRQLEQPDSPFIFQYGKYFVRPPADTPQTDAPLQDSDPTDNEPKPPKQPKPPKVVQQPKSPKPQKTPPQQKQKQPKTTPADFPPDVRIENDFTLHQKATHDLAKDLFGDQIVKVGSQSGLGITTLSFRFPDIVLAEKSELITQLAEKSGWVIEVSPHAYPAALNEVARVVLGDHFPDSAQLGIDHNFCRAKATLHGYLNPDLLPDITKRFCTLTGYALTIIQKNTMFHGDPPPPRHPLLTPKPPPKGIDSAAVCNTIRAAFADKPHTLMRVGIKNNYAELGFLTHEVARLHWPALESLSSTLAVPIRIRSTIDQTPLRALACDLIAAHGLDAPKQPAVFPDARVLVARLSDLSNTDAIQSVQITFHQLTLWTLQVTLFDPNAGPTTAPLPGTSPLTFDPLAPLDSDAGKPSS